MAPQRQGLERLLDVRGSGVLHNSVISETYRTRVVRDSSGTEYPLSSEVDPEEGLFLYDLISSDPTIVKTLEVGCAYGLSSLHICEALRGRPGARHTIIDPKQSDVWHGVGVAQLKRSGIDFFQLLEESSEIALPQLLGSDPEGYDLAFIDGWHSFDQTLVDLFYANRLVRVGGYIVVDDCNWPAVSAAVSYISSYPSNEIVPAPTMPVRTRNQRIGAWVSRLLPPRVARCILPTGIYDHHYRRVRFRSMVAIKRVSADNRSWDWFAGI